MFRDVVMVAFDGCERIWTGVRLRWESGGVVGGYWAADEVIDIGRVSA